MIGGRDGGFGSTQILDALPHPVFTLDENNLVTSANPAADAFFGTSLAGPRQHLLTSLLPVDSSLLTLIEQVRLQGGAINEHHVRSRPCLGSASKSPSTSSSLRSCRRATSSS